MISEEKKKEVIDGLKNIGNSVLGYFGMSLDNFKLNESNKQEPIRSMKEKKLKCHQSLINLQIKKVYQAVK